MLKQLANQTQLFNNANYNLFADPLEQFENSAIYQGDFKEARMLTFRTDVCGVNRWISDVMDFLSFYFETAYMTFNEYLLNKIVSANFLFIYFLFLLSIVVYFCVTTSVKKQNVRVVNPVNFLFNSLEQLTKTILKSNTNLEKQEYFSILYFLFLFIFIANVLGLIPFSYTVTSSFIVTFFLAGAHFLAINIAGIYKHGWQFFKLFLPSGVPIFIAPFLVLIEIVSYIAKVFSLSIRLFANMMSGHALLKILIGFSWAMLAKGGLFYGLAIFPWAVVTLIFFLELLIAFLQAYVFVVLIAIYINDIFSSH